jgi:hypothetical protein
MAPGVMGTVLAVDGSAVTVQDSRQQGNVAVTLTENTQIFKQATIAMTDVAVGESLTAMGSLNLAANGQMTRQVAGTSADIVAGMQLMARGEQSDATIAATRIDIILR